MFVYSGLWQFLPNLNFDIPKQGLVIGTIPGLCFGIIPKRKSPNIGFKKINWLRLKENVQKRIVNPIIPGLN